MKLYLIRHGQSENNATARHSGWMQIHLTETGRAQALALGKRLEGITFDKVYTSDLIRAIETCRLALPDTPSEPTSALREIGVGSLEGREFALCDEEYGEPYRKHRLASDYTAYGGENKEMFQARIRGFLETVASEPHKRVTAFCHAGVIRNALEIITDTSLSPSFACDNCGVSVFEYKDGAWRVIYWNCMGL